MLRFVAFYCACVASSALAAQAVTDRFPLATRFSFDPSAQTVFFDDAPVPLAAWPKRSGGGFQAQAFSGAIAPVDAALLPLPQFRVERLERLGPYWIAQLRNAHTGYGALAVLDPQNHVQPSLRFLNTRTFSRFAQSPHTPRLGVEGPMKGMDAFAVDEGFLYAVRADGTVWKLTLAGASFRFEELAISAPATTATIALGVENDRLLFLGADGVLRAVARDEGTTTIVADHTRVFVAEGDGSFFLLRDLPRRAPEVWELLPGARRARRRGVAGLETRGFATAVAVATIDRPERSRKANDGLGPDHHRWCGNSMSGGSASPEVQ